MLNLFLSCQLTVKQTTSYTSNNLHPQSRVKTESHKSGKFHDILQAYHYRMQKNTVVLTDKSGHEYFILLQPTQIHSGHWYKWDCLVVPIRSCFYSCWWRFSVIQFMVNCCIVSKWTRGVEGKVQTLCGSVLTEMLGPLVNPLPNWHPCRSLGLGGSRCECVLSYRGRKLWAAF